MSELFCEKHGQRYFSFGTTEIPRLACIQCISDEKDGLKLQVRVLGELESWLDYQVSCRGPAYRPGIEGVLTKIADLKRGANDSTPKGKCPDCGGRGDGEHVYCQTCGDMGKKVTSNDPVIEEPSRNQCVCRTKADGCLCDETKRYCDCAECIELSH